MTEGGETSGTTEGGVGNDRGGRNVGNDRGGVGNDRTAWSLCHACKFRLCHARWSPLCHLLLVSPLCHSRRFLAGIQCFSFVLFIHVSLHGENPWVPD